MYKLDMYYALPDVCSLGCNLAGQTALEVGVTGAETLC